MILNGISKLISLTNPNKWYSLSYNFTKHYAKFKRIPQQNLTHINCAIKLDALLFLLSKTGKPFPIPVKVKGIELFRKPRPNGLILCSAHMPLLPVAMRTLVEAEIKLDALIIKEIVKGNGYPLLGINYQIPVINNSPSVLIQARSVLAKGGTLIVLTDEDTGYKNYSPNIFLLSEKLKSNIIYFFTELKPDGYIEVSFYEAPLLTANPDDIIRNQIRALNNYRNTIFNIEQDFVIETIG